MVIGALAAVQLRLTRPSALSAQEILFTKQTESLIELNASAAKGTLLDFKDILVVVDQSLVQDLLRAVTPMEAEVGGGFRVRIDSADTAFGDGVALVRLTGIATRDGSTVGAEVTVFGAINAVQVDPASGVLRCSVVILGVEAADASALGLIDPVGRLTEALAHGGLSMLLEGFEIPVRVENHLLIPAVASKRLQILAEKLPLTVSAERIKVFGGKLWIFVDVALRPAPAPTGEKS